MVDKSDLGQINQLYDEYRLINAALDNFNAGGQIIQMTISGGPPNAPPPSGPTFTPPRMSVSLPTTGITYPAAMVEAIKSALNARVGEINDELVKFGVTGVTQAAAPAPAAQRAR